MHEAYVVRSRKVDVRSVFKELFSRRFSRHDFEKWAPINRAGRLAEAENFILASGFKNNPIMWRALLSSCRVYKDTVAGKRAAMKVIELEPQDSSSYVLLHNIYADAALEPLAARIRELMQQRGVRKEPGLSWI
ncbi:hypothetical protein GOBAR_AA34039 [Gossypium barbadense]|uniref:DYW domain-containing protein n=1 Tax=Gossypium barbadense TaxID=3634 RepID=A0A2P5W6D9_GOSBA|nr:hypothetical protein GOBAR_AA34039 [Gossypium barbadense]